MRLHKTCVMEVYKEEKGKVRRFIYQSKKGVNKQFGRKMNQNIYGNRKLLLEEVSNVNGRKMESCSRIKDEKWGLAIGGDEIQRI